MTGEEVAFWLMMGFSCLIGVFIGYLLFSPRGTRAGLADDLDLEDDRFDDPADEPGIDPDTVPQKEPWLADRETLREQARERAMTRMAESEKRVRQEQAAAAQAGGAREASSPPASAPASPATQPTTTAPATEPVMAGTAGGDRDQPYFNPETIKAWDQASTPGRRRKPGTWVKADGAPRE